MSRELVLKWPIPETVDKELENEIVYLTKEEVVLRLFVVSPEFGVRIR